MNLVVGIVFGTILMGLFVKRWHPLHWVVLVLWIGTMLTVFYFKNR